MSEFDYFQLNALTLNSREKAIFYNLCEGYGVSETTVKQVLSGLLKEGIIEMKSNNSNRGAKDIHKSTLMSKQQSYPYSRYINHPYRNPPVPIEVGAKIAQPMEPERSLRMEDINKLLDPSYNADDMGYCIQEDGTGYIGQTIRFDGATREMFLWWFSWHGHETVRYRIWDPRNHKASKSSLRHIVQRLDTNLSLTERFVNTTNFTVHLDSKGKPDPGYMSFLAPEVYGFNMSLYDENKISVVCAVNGKADSPFPWFSSLRVLQDIPEGFLMRIYFWYGKVVFNGNIIRVKHNTSLESLYPMAEHVAIEYNRLADILPLVYRENHNIVNSPEEFDAMPV